MMTKTKTMAGCALGLCMIAGCAESGELQPAPAPVLAHSSAYVAAPVCGPAKVGSLRELLPDDKITGALELDVQHLQRGVLFAEVERTLEAKGADVVAGMKACGVPLAKVEGVVMGFSDHDDVVFGIKAKGLGEGSTLDCLAKTIESATHEVPWTRTTTGCTTTLEVPDGQTKGFVVGRDMVVFASKSLEGVVARRVEGKDRSALEGRLGWVRGEVDMSRTAWMAARVPKGASAGLGGSMAAVDRVGVSIDATRGLGLRLGAGFGSGSAAKAAASELEAQVGQLKAMLPMIGLSSAVGDSIEIGSKGNVVRMAVFLGMADLEAMRTMIEGTMGGGPSAPPPPPPPRRGM